MTERVSKIFDFACANPDYWELMRQTYEPPEVVEFDPRRREAFNAARSEVQRQCRALLDEVHKEIKVHAAGTALEPAFGQGVNQPSYEKATFTFKIFTGRGRLTWAKISLEAGANGRIGAYCGLVTAAARLSSMLQAFESVVAEERLQSDAVSVYVEEPIPLDAPLAEIASRLVSVFWPGVVAYSEVLSAKAEAAADDE